MIGDGRCLCGRYVAADGKPCRCAGWLARVRYAVKRRIVRRRARRIAERMRMEVWHG